MTLPRENRVKAAYGRTPISVEEYNTYAKIALEARFEEDANTDVTIAAVGKNDIPVKAIVKAKEAGVLAGLNEVLSFYADHRITVNALKNDGEKLKKGDIIAELAGTQSDLLKVERTGLNMLQRMSGIATRTRRLVKITGKFGVRIVGTRKTLINAMDKKAIILGGGLPHRYGLYDAILIKDNHLSAISRESAVENPVVTALERAFAFQGNPRPAFIEIETSSPKEAMDAAETYSSLVNQRASQGDIPFIIMLDNMTPSKIKRIVKKLKKRELHDLVLLEASGGITEKKLKNYSKSGVDAISIGAITHSVSALDISQKILRGNE